MDPAMSVLVLAHVEADGSLAQAGARSADRRRAASRSSSACRWPSAWSAPTSPAAASRRRRRAAPRACSASSGAAFAESRYVTDAAAAEAICRAAGAADRRRRRHVALDARRWPAWPQRLGGRVDTHVTRVAVDGGAVSVARWYYRQRIEGVTSRTERPWVIAIEPGTHEPWAGARRPPTVEAVAVALPELRTRGDRRAIARRRASRPSGPTRRCCSSPAPAGRRSSRTARRTCRRPRR